MIAFLLFLRAARLATAIASAHPGLPADRVAAASVAIVLEAGDHDPYLLATMLTSESTLDPWQVGEPLGACGIGQIVYSDNRAVQDRRCRRILGDVRLGVRAAVRKLDDGADFCARRGDLSELCALTGYASGPDGVRGGWHRRPRSFLAGRDALRSRAELLWPLAGGAS